MEQETNNKQIEPISKQLDCCSCGSHRLEILMESVIPEGVELQLHCISCGCIQFLNINCNNTILLQPSINKEVKPNGYIG